MSNEQVTQEIIDIHLLFQQWYRGEIPKSFLETRIAPRLAENFFIIFPDGQKQTRTELVEMMRGDYGNEPTFCIEIAHIQIDPLSDIRYSASYEEWQRWGDGEVFGILTRSILEAHNKRVQWISIEENRVGS